MFNLVLQNTTSKQIFVYEVDRVSEDSVYTKFKVKLDNPVSGEYNYILFENPENKAIRIGNQFFFSGDPEILITFDDILTNNTQILVAGQNIDTLSKGLLKIKELKEEINNFNTDKTFKQYGS